MKFIAWILVIIGTLLGGFSVVMAIFAEAAPAQAAGAALGVGLAVVPYCFARALEGISNELNKPEKK